MAETLDSREIPWRELGSMILLTAITIIIVIGGSGGEGSDSGTEGAEPKAEAPKPEGGEAKPKQDSDDWKYADQPGFAPSGDTSGQYRH